MKITHKLAKTLRGSFCDALACHVCMHFVIAHSRGLQLSPTRNFLHSAETTATTGSYVLSCAGLMHLLLQVVDLEVAADHRGSILGDHPTRLQPPQKMFESKLLHQMRNFSVHRPVFIESESSLVGRRQVPNAMWKVCTTCRTQIIMPEDDADRSLHS